MRAVLCLAPLQLQFKSFVKRIRCLPSDRIIEIYDKYNQGDKALDYRAIRYRELERGGVVVASSGFEQSKDNGWKELDKNHLLVASNVTGKYGIYSL